MKIVKDFDQEGVPLHTIKAGELFMYDGSYFMRCDDPHTLMNWTNEEGARTPAVDMASGEIRWVNINIKVPPIYARIRINGRAD